MYVEELRKLLLAKNAPQLPWDDELRKQAKKRDEGMCRLCDALGLGIAASEVHHIVPRGKGGDRRKNTLINLISVCRKHHDMLEKHKRQIIFFDGSREFGALTFIRPATRKEKWELIAALPSDFSGEIPGADVYPVYAKETKLKYNAYAQGGEHEEH